jgi:hypothetical protein
MLKRLRDGGHEPTVVGDHEVVTREEGRGKKRHTVVTQATRLVAPIFSGWCIEATVTSGDWSETCTPLYVDTAAQWWTTSGMWRATGPKDTAQASRAISLRPQVD